MAEASTLEIDQDLKAFSKSMVDKYLTDEKLRTAVETIMLEHLRGLWFGKTMAQHLAAGR